MNEFRSLLIEQTPKTPQIELSQLTGDLIFTGKSIPENAAKLYEPVLKWVTEYIKFARQTTNIRFDLEYFNTASLLWMTKILKTLIQINKPDYVLIIHLYLPVEEFDEISEFDDLKDAFIPISSILQEAVPCIGIKLYGKDENDSVIKHTVVFLEQGEIMSARRS